MKKTVYRFKLQSGIVVDFNSWREFKDKLPNWDIDDFGFHTSYVYKDKRYLVYMQK